jgi:hypothetical protein
MINIMFFTIVIYMFYYYVSKFTCFLDNHDWELHMNGKYLICSKCGLAKRTISKRDK